jgi:cathepsin A (carboxypeptidase C)
MARLDLLGAQCLNGIDYEDPMIAFSASDVCDIAVPEIMNKPTFNIYDITKPCVGRLCYDMGHFIDFFTSKAVKDELKIEPESKWTLCNTDVYEAIASDGNTDSMLNAIPMLNDGVPILFYTGMNDYCCNWRGTEQVLHDV